MYPRMYKLSLKFNLTNSQLNKLSEVLVAMGEVLFASLVVPFFIGIDNIHFIVVILGIISTSSCWITSIVIVRRIRK